MEKKNKLKGRKEIIIKDLDMEGKKNEMEAGGNSKKRNGKWEESMVRIYVRIKINNI